MGSMFFSATNRWRTDDAMSLDFDTTKKVAWGKACMCVCRLCGARMCTLLPHECPIVAKGPIIARNGQNLVKTAGRNRWKLVRIGQNKVKTMSNLANCHSQNNKLQGKTPRNCGNFVAEWKLHGGTTNLQHNFCCLSNFLLHFAPGNYC